MHVESRETLEIDVKQSKKSHKIQLSTAHCSKLIILSFASKFTLQCKEYHPFDDRSIYKNLHAH